MRSRVMLWLLLNTALITQAAGAEDKSALTHNPFNAPILETRASSSAGRLSAEELQDALRGTLRSERLSMVNMQGQLISVGEAYKGYRLVAVGEGAATFEQDGQRVVIRVIGEEHEDEE